MAVWIFGTITWDVFPQPPVVLHSPLTSLLFPTLCFIHQTSTVYCPSSSSSSSIPLLPSLNVLYVLSRSTVRSIRPSTHLHIYPFHSLPVLYFLLLCPPFHRYPSFPLYTNSLSTLPLFPFASQRGCIYLSFHLFQVL